MNREAAGLYLHVPFCSSICPYCDFAVLRGDSRRRQLFVSTLIDEIGLWAGQFEEVDTVYFGGGTPSLLSRQQLSVVLQSIRGAIELRNDTFYTIEVNPEDADGAALGELRDLGFDMISLGVQSLDARSLEFLDRGHTPDQARQAVVSARELGFPIVSLDLIYGLPGQSISEWIQELDAALDLEPDHLSCYQLTIEPRTGFGKKRSRGELVELSEADQARFFVETHRRLAERGFPAYEVSNFARSEDHRSPHNQKYWRHRPYLGLGPSAHSFRKGKRWWNHRHLETWRRELEAGRSPIHDHEDLSTEQIALEFVMLSLRQPEGLDLEEYRRRFGGDLLSSNEAEIYEYLEDGLLRLDGSRLEPTLHGLVVAEGLAASLSLPFNLQSSPGQKPPSDLP